MTCSGGSEEQIAGTGGDTPCQASLIGLARVPNLPVHPRCLHADAVPEYRRSSLTCLMPDVNTWPDARSCRETCTRAPGVSLQRHAQVAVLSHACEPFIFDLQVLEDKDNSYTSAFCTVIDYNTVSHTTAIVVGSIIGAPDPGFADTVCDPQPPPLPALHTVGHVASRIQVFSCARQV